MRDRKRVYLEIWSRIKKRYFGGDGYLFNEGTLQAELYAELRNTLPDDVYVVAAPRLKIGGDSKHPDLVIVEKGQITDIFEIKIWSRDVLVQGDIEKLLRYGANNETCRVRCNPNTGDWEGELPVFDSCRLHSVVVAWHENKAVCPTSVREWVRDMRQETQALQENPRVLNHWFGRIGGDTDETRKWSIEFGIR